MKRIFTLLSAFAFCGMMQAQDIPSFTYDQGFSYPSGPFDGSPGSVFDPANMCCLYQGAYVISAMNVGSMVIAQGGGAAIVDMQIPPFVSSFIFSVDDPVLAAGNPSIRITLLGEEAVGTPAPTFYTLGDISESNWAFITSANRNYRNDRDPNFTSQSSVARFAIYNGLNWGYTTLSDYTSDIPLSDIDITWVIAQEDSLDYVNWANGSTVGVAEEEQKEIISVYPNPSQNLINITGTSNIEAYRILDLTGKIVKSEENFNTNQIDISNLENGMYFLSLETKNGTTTKRIIKE